MTRNSGFPRLLVVTEFPPNASGGGPAIVRQMLQRWPAEKLLWWSCLPDSTKKFGRDVAAHFVAGIPSRLYPHITLPRFKAWLLNSTWRHFAARHLKRSIKLSKPDVIWAIPHQWSILPQVEVLWARSYHVSIHDYPDVHNSRRRLGLNVTNELILGMQQLYRLGTSRDAISNEMAADLEAVTTKPAAQILHSGVEPRELAYLQQKRSLKNRTITIAYAGTIAAKESFALFVAALSQIRKGFPSPIELHFFGAHRYEQESWFEKQWMIEHGNLTPEELTVRLRQCQWGFIPMELDDNNPRYNRYSLPTKIVSYLAAGLGIISVGHTASTVIRLARRYSFGIAIDETNASRMDEVLIQALSVDDPWSQFAEEILRCAHQEFDAASMRDKLHAMLQSQRPAI